jgi:hypothetical protein
MEKLSKNPMVIDLQKRLEIFGREMHKDLLD